jgi:hypothetical protein
VNLMWIIICQEMEKRLLHLNNFNPHVFLKEENLNIKVASPIKSLSIVSVKLINLARSSNNS